MADYQVMSFGADNPDDPEVMFTNFLIANWSDALSGVKKENIDFGYEPGVGTTHPFVIKIEENFKDVTGIDVTDRVDQHDSIMDAKIWALDSQKKTTLGYFGFVDYRYKMRSYLERFIKMNRNAMMNTYGIKHLYIHGSRNIPEPERQDWHYAVVTFRMNTFKCLLP